VKQKRSVGERGEVEAQCPPPVKFVIAESAFFATILYATQTPLTPLYLHTTQTTYNEQEVCESHVCGCEKVLTWWESSRTQQQPQPPPIPLLRLREKAVPLIVEHVTDSGGEVSIQSDTFTSRCLPEKDLYQQ